MFAGTPAPALPSFEALLASTHQIAAVLTRPPAPVGRRRVMTPSPVHAYAEEHNIPVLTADPNDPEVLEVLATVDCVAVVAYGAMIRPPALSTPPFGWINLHFSLLPSWRGAAPVQHAIMAGDDETGVSVFQIDQGLDTGPVFNSLTHPIAPDDTAGDVLERLAHAGASVLVETLTGIESGSAKARPQQGPVTLAPTLATADGRIDWSQPASQVRNHIRGITPVPGAWTQDEQGGRYKVGAVSPSDHPDLPPGQVEITKTDVVVGTGSHPLALQRMAPPGRPWMDAAAWARGLQDKAIRFGGTQ